ncbi:hypothetical protein KM043_012189 [Ampulex compressa]|nr:hypothetical protein KM043_012189 [Ampulex compressa]
MSSKAISRERNTESPAKAGRSRHSLELTLKIGHEGAKRHTPVIKARRVRDPIPSSVRVLSSSKDKNTGWPEEGERQGLLYARLCATIIP